MDTIWFAIWFFLPAGVANATPVFANKIPLLNRWKTPLDFGRSYRGKRIFGANKTWRGLVFGSFIGALTGILIATVYPPSASAVGIAPLLPKASMALLGGLLGLGALSGDAIESFFKRQKGVAAGKSWFPFDQIDYIIGGLLLSSIVVQLSITEYIVVALTWFVLHVVSAYIGYLLKLKDTPI